MSRSTCRPIITCRLTRGHGRKAKRAANKAVRRTPVVADGKAYRKVTETWDIVDYRRVVTPSELAEDDFYHTLHLTRK